MLQIRTGTPPLPFTPFSMYVHTLKEMVQLCHWYHSDRSIQPPTAWPPSIRHIQYYFSSSFSKLPLSPSVCPTVRVPDSDIKGTKLWKWLAVYNSVWVGGGSKIICRMAVTGMGSVIPFTSQSIRRTQMCRNLHLSRFARHSQVTHHHHHPQYAPDSTFYVLWSVCGGAVLCCPERLDDQTEWLGMKWIGMGLVQEYKYCDRGGVCVVSHFAHPNPQSASDCGVIWCRSVVGQSPTKLIFYF